MIHQYNETVHWHFFMRPYIAGFSFAMVIVLVWGTPSMAWGLHQSLSELESAGPTVNAVQQDSANAGTSPPEYPDFRVVPAMDSTTPPDESDMYASQTTKAGIAVAQTSKASSPISLADAINAALEHNHQIRATRVGWDAAAASVTRGNAGQLPTVGISSEISGSYSDLEIQPGSLLPSLTGAQPGAGAPGSMDYSGVSGSVISAGVGIEYVLYDGGQGATRYRLLESSSAISSLQHRTRVEQTLLKVSATYNKMVLLQQVVRIHELALQQSYDRYRIVRTRGEFGQANQQEELQALVDLTSDSTAWRHAQLQLNQASGDLQQVIGQELESNLKVDSVVRQVTLPEKNILYQRLQGNNTAMHIARERLNQSELQVRLAVRQRMPVVTASARYSYTRNYTSEGLFELQEQLGVAGGVSVQIPIFAGGRNRSAVREAEARQQQESIYRDAIQQELQIQFENLWNQQDFLIEKNQTNQAEIALYERNYDRAMEAFEQGLTSGIALRAAQLSLLQAHLQRIETEVDQAVNATTLLYLSGQLLVDN